MGKVSARVTFAFALGRCKYPKLRSCCQRPSMLESTCKLPNGSRYIGCFQCCVIWPVQRLADVIRCSYSDASLCSAGSTMPRPMPAAKPRKSWDRHLRQVLASIRTCRAVIMLFRTKHLAGAGFQRSFGWELSLCWTDETAGGRA